MISRKKFNSEAVRLVNSGEWGVSMVGLFAGLASRDCPFSVDDISTCIVHLRSQIEEEFPPEVRDRALSDLGIAVRTSFPSLAGLLN